MPPQEQPRAPADARNDASNPGNSSVTNDNAADEELDPVVKRILRRRRQDCGTLGNDKVQSIVAPEWGSVSDAPELSDGVEKFLFLLTRCFRRAACSKVKAQERREAYEILQRILFSLDTELGELEKKQGDRDNSATVESRPHEPQDKPSVSSRRAVDPSSSSKKSVAPGSQTSTKARRASAPPAPESLGRLGNEPSRGNPSEASKLTTSRGKNGFHAHTASNQTYAQMASRPQHELFTPTQAPAAATVPRSNSSGSQRSRASPGSLQQQSLSQKVSNKENSHQKQSPTASSTASSNAYRRNGAKPQSSSTHATGGPKRNSPDASASQSANGRSSSVAASQAATGSKSSKPNNEEQRTTTKDYPSALSQYLQHGERSHGSTLGQVRALLQADILPNGRTVSGSMSIRNEQAEIQLPRRTISDDEIKDIDQRIQRWEPFYKPIAYAAIGTTSTAKVIRKGKIDNDFAATAAQIILNPVNIALSGPGIRPNTSLANYAKCNWGTAAVRGGVALMLMMFPLKPTVKEMKKRSGCHLWPKGTFLQIQGVAKYIVQRKQQNHDLSEWKGVCHPLDLGEVIKDPKKLVKIDISCYDKSPFGYCVGLFHFQKPEQLLKEVLDTSGPQLVQRPSRAQCMQAAVAKARQQVVSLEMDENVEPDLGKIVFSLKCPISHQLMKTPVRSSKCKHFQCFDLKNYLNTMQRPNGARWRCGVCDPRFVPIDELHVCRLTADLLQEFDKVASSSRDRVELIEDCSYRLLEEKRARNRGQKRPGPTTQGQPAPKRQAQHVEIIIDD